MRCKRWIAFVLAVFLVSCRHAETEAQPPVEKSSDLRAVIREEVRAVLKDDFSLDEMQDGMREQIQALILEEVRSQLAKRDWDKELGSEKLVASLEKLQRQARSGHSGAMPDAVDLTGLSSNREKIQRILQELEGVTTYYQGSPLTKQLRDLGPGAKRDLFQALQATPQQDWAARKAVADALGPMLTVEDREFFLQDAASDQPGLLQRAVALNIEEVGDLALEKIAALGPNDFVHFELANAAMHFHEQEAATILLNRIASGGSNSAWLAQHIRRQLPNLPMREPLAAAAQHLEKSSNLHDRHSIAPLLLSEGIPQGLGFAADSLLSSENNHWQEQTRSAIRQYVNVLGSDEDVAAYLLQNRNNLRWNPTLRIYEEIQPSGFFD